MENNENVQKNRKGLLIIAGILLAVVIVLVGYIFISNNGSDDKEKKQNTNTNSNSNVPKELAKGTFKLTEEDAKGGFGSAEVEGYVVITQKQVDSLCEEECEMFDYVFFKILRTKNTDFLAWIEDGQGNSYFDDNAVGLGALQNETLSWTNAADEYEDEKLIKSFELSKEDTARIMASTSADPIILELESLLLSAGSGAPSNYSHISTIKIK